VIAAVILAELAGIALAYQILTDFECRAVESELTCRLLRSLVARGIVVLAALGLFAWLRRPAGSHDRLPSLAPAGPAPHRAAATAFAPTLRAGDAYAWMALHLLGVALLLQPLALGPAADPRLFFERSLGPWLAGASLATMGAVFWLAPLQEWMRWLARERYAPLLIVGVGLVVPDLADLILPLWTWQPLTSATFAAVERLLSLVGTGIHSDPEAYVIGLEGFHVQVAEQCSGIEGLALIASFVVLYGVLFRQDLRPARYWLVVLPLGLAASWALNVLRIVALILIGARLSPQLAVNGFHSYAGWMQFTLLALGLMALVHVTPALRKRPDPGGATGLREDWLAARMLPLALFLATGTVGAALTLDVELAAPFRALALAGALAYFWPSYRRIGWTRDPVALLAGLAVGLAWTLTEPAAPNGPTLRDTLSGLAPAALVAWIALRVLGSAVLVPITEEIFFRGYLLARLDFGGVGGKAVGIAVSSALFAVLHGRWIAAGLAGAVFALVMLRRNRLGDAILAHMAANGVIALSALVRGDWAGL
jgi:hypothetical protein